MELLCSGRIKNTSKNAHMKIKQINIPCECAGKEKTCGFLRITNFGGGDFEFSWTPKRNTKKAKVGVYVYKEKTIKKIKEFLC